LGIDRAILEEQCDRTLAETRLRGFGQRIEGKVRDSYVAHGLRSIVVTDRVSAFDVIIGTLPFKGQVLNGIAAFWFERTREVAPNHLVALPDPVVSVVRECEVLPVEFVFRRYLTGVSKTSIWSAYERGERFYCGHRLPDGLHKNEPLPKLMLTPTTKASQGAHDELTSRETLIEQGQISEAHYEEAARLGAALFAAGSGWAESRGMILVDTKYEMGVGSDGRIVLVDEIHTPDSSRYWYRESYEKAMREGLPPSPLDKEYLRRWLVEQGYSGVGAPPEVPTAVRCEAAQRYIEAYETLTGTRFEPSTEPPVPRIERNLRRFFDENV